MLELKFRRDFGISLPTYRLDWVVLSYSKAAIGTPYDLPGSAGGCEWTPPVPATIGASTRSSRCAALFFGQPQAWRPRKLPVARVGYPTLQFDAPPAIAEKLLNG